MRTRGQAWAGVERLESRRLLAAAELDLSFGGGDGIATLSTAVNARTDRGQFVAVDTQGRTVVVGTTAADRNFGTPVDILVTRFLPDGSLDTTFGGGGAGYVTRSFLNSDTPTDLAVQPDGKILVAFRNAGPATWGVMRLNADGSSDASFDGDGVAAYDFGTETITKMALQADGKIVTVGSATHGATSGVQMAAVRMTATGALDTTFSGDGIFAWAPLTGAVNELYDVTTDRGRIVVAGRVRANAQSFDQAYVTRLTSNGIGDGTFGGRWVTMANTHVTVNSVAADAVGRVTVAATLSPDTLLTPLPLTLFRFTATGATDTAFNAAGPTPGRLDLPQATIYAPDPAEMFTLDDGTVLFGGAASSNTGTAFQVVRVRPDGTPDAGWDGDGVARYSPTAPRLSVGTDMALDPMRRLVLSGLDTASAASTDYDVAVIRVDAGLEPPVTVQPGGVLRVRGTPMDDTVSIIRWVDFFVTLNGTTFQFPAASVTSIDVELFDGNDTQTHNGGVPAGRVDLGHGNNNMTIGANNPTTARLEVYAGDGSDTLTLASGARTWVYYDGGGTDFSVTDFLVYHGTDAADTFNITPTQIDLGGLYPVEYTSLQSYTVEGGAGSDTFLVPGTSVHGIYTLKGGGGDDQFTVTNGSGGTHRTTVSVAGGADNDTFTYDNSQSLTGASIYQNSGNFNGHAVDYEVETMRLVGGANAAGYAVYPSTTTRMYIDGRDPTAFPGDRLQTWPGAPVVSHTRTDLRDGTITFNNGYLPLHYIGFERVTTPLDTAAPTGTIAYEHQTRQAVTATFSEDVYFSVDPGDLVLTNLTTGQTVPSSAYVQNVTVGVGLPTTVTWQLFAGQVLTDGNYRATIAADAIRDYADKPLAAALTLDFYVLAGDFNRDRVADFADLGILLNNYNASGKTNADGDANYDGLVDFADLGILLNNYNKSLIAPATTAVIEPTPPAVVVTTKKPPKKPKPVSAEPGPTVVKVGRV